MKKILTMLVLLCAAAGLTMGCFFSEDKPAKASEQKVVEQKPGPEQVVVQPAKAEEKAVPEQKQAPVQPAKVEEKAPAPSVEKVQKEHNYSIVIDKSEFTLYLLDNGEIVKSYGCALGKNPGQKQKSGDMKTPTGTFIIDEIIDASAWTHDFGDGKGEIEGAYGPWFLSLDTSELSGGKWDGIGIHGTHDPSSIGTRASEGCIRLLNKNVDELKRHVKVGTKVVIQE